MKRYSTLAPLAALLLSITPGSASGTLAPIDTSEIATSYDDLTNEFYQKTDPQSILDGARTGMLLTLHKAGAKNATLPRIASTTPAANVKAIAREVNLASAVAPRGVTSHLLSYAAIAGMMASVHDRYTMFFTPKEYAEFNAPLDGGAFGGTGIVITVDDQTKYITVSNVIPNGPADKAGVQQDDTILSINGTSTKNLDKDDSAALNKASAKLRGAEGTNVTLVLQRNGATLPQITITRARIEELSVYSRMIPNSKVGYADVTVFGRTTGEELRTAVQRLRDQGARALILDLRDNGGGFLDAAQQVSSLFIQSGPIVSVESRAGAVTTYEADDVAIPPMPLAVLVNGHTASASEITTAAIQEDGAGTIIGTKTFGKGVVQNVYRLPDGAAIKITTARYLTPNNHDINHRGIVPDIVLAENKSPRYGLPNRDAQLQRAMSFITDRLAHFDYSAPAAATNNQ